VDGWQVENYSLAQRSLEQAFLQLTTSDKEKAEIEAGGDESDWEIEV